MLRGSGLSACRATHAGDPKHTKQKTPLCKNKQTIPTGTKKYVLLVFYEMYSKPGTRIFRVTNAAISAHDVADTASRPVSKGEIHQDMTLTHWAGAMSTELRVELHRCRR